MKDNYLEKKKKRKKYVFENPLKRLGTYPEGALIYYILWNMFVSAQRSQKYPSWIFRFNFVGDASVNSVRRNSSLERLVVG